MPEQPQDRIANPTGIIKEYLKDNDEIFRELEEIRARLQGWANPEGDEHFQKKQDHADNAPPHVQRMLYKMMQQIGDEMQAATQALSLSALAPNNRDIRVLDLCMAPGGYSKAILKYNPDATIKGISLPLASGGHKLLLSSDPTHRDQIQCSFLDITMLAPEMGVDTIPTLHPESAHFLPSRPFLTNSFHLALCDGQILRTHPRPAHRAPFEATRLLTSQLVLALQRLAQNGTLILLLHKLHSWNTTSLVHQISRFADVRLFKPVKKHNTRGSFYLIAKNVQPEHEAAKAAVEGWKRDWWQTTFGGIDGTGDVVKWPAEERVRALLDEFGGKLVGLARPIWEIQLEALRNESFTKEKGAR
ncbi:MAG: hypothetical protein Q9160_009134 [Pyrenula sp. 1 TL-2023]